MGRSVHFTGLGRAKDVLRPGNRAEPRDLGRPSSGPFASFPTRAIVFKWGCGESGSLLIGGIEMEDKWFDELSRRLAAPVTRRQAFRTIAAAALGGVLIRSGTGKAFGQGNDDCAHFCNDQFPPGRDRGHCKSDAAKGGGLCYQCGPGANACILKACNGVCCAQGASCSNGICACPAGHGVCGDSGVACFGVGACTDLTTIQNCGSCGNVCTSGQICTNEMCQSSNPECAGASCASPKLCGPSGSNCLCASLFGGGGVCLKQPPPGTTCADLSLKPCPTGTECSPGQHCVVQTCCQTEDQRPVCVDASLTCTA
jgi:hypothetical protein